MGAGKGGRGGAPAKCNSSIKLHMVEEEEGGLIMRLCGPPKRVIAWHTCHVTRPGRERERERERMMVELHGFLITIDIT